MNDFEKLMLKIYPGLDKMIQSVDTAINARIITSFYNDASSYEQTAKILKLIEKKKNLLILKGFIGSAVSGVNDEKQHYLKFYGSGAQYIKPTQDNLSRRTFYRKLNSAVNAFSSEMKRLGVESWYDKHMRGCGFFDYFFVKHRVYSTKSLQK